VPVFDLSRITSNYNIALNTHVLSMLIYYLLNFLECEVPFEDEFFVDLVCESHFVSIYIDSCLICCTFV